MRVGSWALADVLRRIGVTGADLHVGARVGDGIAPVLVMGDVSALSGLPQPRQYGEFGIVGAVPAEFGLVALRDSLPFDVRVRSSTLALNLHISPGTVPIATWVAGNPVVQSYFPPNDPAPNPQLQRFTGSQLGATNFAVEALPANTLSQLWRVSPGQMFLILGTIVNTAMLYNFQVNEFVAMEQQI